MPELVVHSTKWATGSFIFAANRTFLAYKPELVVHSTEWTTGSATIGAETFFRAKGLEAAHPFPSPWLAPGLDRALA